ncbi:FAD-dependent oxidoreductase [Mesorhizobium sp. dw_380]|uniref:FAD-dependent oxidoreductase n=1 Tax=Mesorhizobium sp. dw_380 TaxID=2812001 RepID=UPI0020330A66|nr:FAD-dependent oxidoreductase [Mesorhizobium sp. dw_380]
MRQTELERLAGRGLRETLRDALIADKSARIATKLSRLFPHLDVRPEFAWTGSFGTTTTGLPHIGAIPGHPRIHAVMGYGGNGIIFSQIASEIVSASIGGLDDTDAEPFAFNHWVQSYKQSLIT